MHATKTAKSSKMLHRKMPKSSWHFYWWKRRCVEKARKKLQLLLLAGKSLTGPRKFENLFPEISHQPLFVLPALDKPVRLRLFLKKIFLLLYLGQQNIENHPTKPRSWLACFAFNSLLKISWWICLGLVLVVDCVTWYSWCGSLWPIVRSTYLSKTPQNHFFLRKTYLLQDINMSWLKFGKLVGLVLLGWLWIQYSHSVSQ